MNQEETNDAGIEWIKTYHFPGVTVTVPDQLDGQQVSVFQKPWPDQINMKGNGNFILTRPVINLAMVKPANEKDFFTSFDPPIKINVGYQFQDLFDPAVEGRTLKLGYWDGIDWVELSDEKYRYQVLPPSTAPVCEVFISEWPGDPPIGWGK